MAIGIGVAAYLISLMPPCYADRHMPLETKSAQLTAVAAAIAEVSGDVDEAAWLTAIGWHETRFCYRSHAGGSRVKGKGRGVWQLEAGSRRPRPYEGLSQHETTHAASQALWLIRHSYQCGSSVEGRFTAYAGRPCGTAWPTLRARANTLYWLRAKLKETLAWQGSPVTLPAQQVPWRLVRIQGSRLTRL